VVGCDSSAGIRGVRSAGCKVTLYTALAYRTALCSVTRNRCRSGGQPLTFLDVLTMEMQDILLVVQSVLNLIHPSV
jgi:hypothetical protein